MDNLNTDLIAKSLCFHGQPLQKIWDGERGSNDLARLGINNQDYSVYITRQKNLTFQDRAKRFKLHQFIARKATNLFDSSLIDDLPGIRRRETQSLNVATIMPPFETFLSKNIDKSKHIHQILSAIQPGDIIYGTVTTRGVNSIAIKVLCTGEPIIRYLADISIKAYILTQNIKPALDKKGNTKTYSTSDYVCCEVLDVSADADRMALGMKGTLTIDTKAPLGLITAEQLPEYYKRTVANAGSSYEEILENSKGFLNPNCVSVLFQEIGLNINDNLSNMSGLNRPIPKNEYASELRQIQASKWAFRSVADGIEHFKVGRHSEAFQCLNKALNIDPRNVEGLVARGALYANSGSFKKAVEDFEIALKLNPYHANARKYMGETLVALARSYEEEGLVDEAWRAYMDCLKIIPHHEEAKSSLEFLKGRVNLAPQIIDTTDFMVPNYKVANDNSHDSQVAIKKIDDFKKDRSGKKKKSKSKKYKQSSSSSTSVDSSASSDSSSDSSDSSRSNSSSSDSDSSKSSLRKRKTSRSEKNRKKSLSPISKRIAIMDEQSHSTGISRYQFNQPFHLANAASSSSASTASASVPPPPATADDYDIKVRNFLELTRDEDDYESQVRKLIEEASKYRKGKLRDEKSRKKEKKKQKRMKKESKKEKRKREKAAYKEKLESLKDLDIKNAMEILKTLPKMDYNNPEYGKIENIKHDIFQRHAMAPSTSKLEISNEREIIPESRSPPPSHPVIVDHPVYYPQQQPHLQQQQHLQQQAQLQHQIPPPQAMNFTDTRSGFNQEKNFAETSVPGSSGLYKRISGGNQSAERPYAAERSPSPAKPLNVVPPKPPVVLDKFGCFRLALDEKKLDPVVRKSRSLSPQRRYSSRSRSRSRSRHRLTRSPRRSRSMRRSRSRRRSRTPRRSRSNRRTRSPRRSRSFRRSRSSRRSRSRHRTRSPPPRRRSRSLNRRRSRSFEMGGRWNSRSRSRSFSRSFSRSPEQWRRGRWQGQFRGRGFGRHRGRSRGGRGGFRGRRSPLNRNSSFDDKRDYRRNDDNYRDDDKRKSRKFDNDIEGKWAHDKYEKNKYDDSDRASKAEEEENWDKDDKEPTVEEIDKIINKAQKDRKEEILQRDKDLLKKQTPNNLPF